nr:hypothetical protein [Candidatus Sigynarchaeum springense]MDO8118612.1 hypothetical protein [Candidatus Sigynarchaeota archaeon]
MGTKNIPKNPVEAKKEDCESCKFNLGMDDEKLRCEFAKMLGKNEPGCENYEKK